jgi:hypothetical protein
MTPLFRDMAVLGMPGVLSTWGFDLIRAAAALLGEDIEFRTVDRNDEVEDFGGFSRSRRMFWLSQFASPSLRKALSDTASPIVIFLDDPIDSVRYLKFASGCATLEAIRAQTAAAAGYADISSNSRALIITRATHSNTITIIRLILEHLHLDLGTSDYQDICTNFAGPEGEAASLEASLVRCVGGYVVPERAADGLTAPEIQIVTAALAPIVRAIAGGEAAPIVWPTAVFFSGDRPNQPASLVAEVTGAARILYYGPYLYLPAGRWTVRMTLGFTENARGTPISVEVHCGGLRARATIDPAGSGVFKASFLFVHDAPHEAVEIRVASERGAIEGRLSLGRVEFSQDKAESSGVTARDNSRAPGALENLR